MKGKICPYMSRPILRQLLEVECLGKRCAATYEKVYMSKTEYICTRTKLVVEEIKNEV
jgi:hypothetical protein